MRISELQILVDNQSERVKELLARLDRSEAAHMELAEKLEVYRLTRDPAFAVLEHKVEELRKGHDVWGGRLFTLILALISGAIGALVSYYIRKP